MYSIGIKDQSRGCEPHKTTVSTGLVCCLRAPTTLSKTKSAWRGALWFFFRYFEKAQISPVVSSLLRRLDLQLAPKLDVFQTLIATQVALAMYREH